MTAHPRMRRLAVGGLGLALMFTACTGDDGAAPDSLAFAAPGACTGDIVIAIDADLAEGFVESAGPFTATIPAGVYDIQMESWADIDEIDEPNERWYFSTDGGYTSPLIDDPGAVNVRRQTFTDQVLSGDSTSLSVFHMLPGDDVANSVVAKCVSFTSVEVAQTTTTAAPTTTTVAETTTTVAETTTTVAETTTTVAETTTTAAPRTTTTLPDTQTQSNAPAEDPAELALTGAGDLAVNLAITGSALTLAGYAALRASRRRDEV